MVRKEKKKQGKILGLAILLVIVLISSLVFVGAVSGWFEDTKVVLDREYTGKFEDFKTISAEEYEELINKKASFVLMIDQSGCHTADRLREFAKDWGTEKEVKFLKMMFSDMKGTSLHDYVKYYPSVVVISRGRPIGYLRADSDEDADEYNDYDAFKEWIEKYF